MSEEYANSGFRPVGGDALRRALASNRNDERVAALLEMVIARLDRIERSLREPRQVVNNVTYVAGEDDE